MLFRSQNQNFQINNSVAGLVAAIQPLVSFAMKFAMIIFYYKQVQSVAAQFPLCANRLISLSTIQYEAEEISIPILSMLNMYVQGTIGILPKTFIVSANLISQTENVLADISLFNKSLAHYHSILRTSQFVQSITGLPQISGEKQYEHVINKSESIIFKRYMSDWKARYTYYNGSLDMFGPGNIETRWIESFDIATRSVLGDPELYGYAMSYIIAKVDYSTPQPGKYFEFRPIYNNLINVSITDIIKSSGTNNLISRINNAINNGDGVEIFTPVTIKFVESRVFEPNRHLFPENTLLTAELGSRVVQVTYYDQKIPYTTDLKQVFQPFGCFVKNTTGKFLYGFQQFDDSQTISTSRLMLSYDIEPRVNIGERLEKLVQVVNL